MSVDMHRVHATHVTVKQGKKYLFDGRPIPFVLDTGPYVWVTACSSDEGQHRRITRIRDGRSSGYDINGGCILSVPAEWCAFHDQDEAYQIIQAMDADEKLLGEAQ